MESQEGIQVTVERYLNKDYMDRRLDHIVSQYSKTDIDYRSAVDVFKDGLSIGFIRPPGERIRIKFVGKAKEIKATLEVLPKFYFFGLEIGNAFFKDYASSPAESQVLTQDQLDHIDQRMSQIVQLFGLYFKPDADTEEFHEIFRNQFLNSDWSDPKKLN